SADVPRVLREKLASFSRVSDAIFEPTSIGSIDDDDIDIGLIVSSVLSPFENKYRGDGPPCVIPRHSLTPLILFLHELATNSIKYGAFSADGGVVHITWTAKDGAIVLQWSENCEAPVPEMARDPGFGTNMVERLARSIGGAVRSEWVPNGLVTELRFPEHVQEA